jgi:hypothetical protein
MSYGRRSGDRSYSLSIEAELRLTAEYGGMLHRYHGMLAETDPYEMYASAVVLDAPQELVDRVAQLIELTNELEGGKGEELTGPNFYALLAGRTRCSICGRALQDEVSKLCGVGLDCAEKYRIPHTLEAAFRRAELRKQLLGATP